MKEERQIAGLGRPLLRLFENRYLIGQLVLRDLRDRYAGSALGLIWPFLQQVSLMLIVGTVLQYGLKASTGGSISYVVLLTPAFSLWLFFAEAITSSTTAFQQYSYLVKKVNFQVVALPLVKILTAVVNHLIMLAIVFFVLVANGVLPSLYWFQVLYYGVASAVLLTGLSLLLSSLSIFVKDVIPIVGIVVTFLNWVTPIFWTSKNLDVAFQIVVWANPVAYLAEGYRNSFIYGKGFWEEPLWAAYYWVVAFTILGLGAFIYRRLRPHFGDVL